MLVRLVQLYVGLVLYGISSSLLVLAGLGLDPWDVFHQGLSRTFGLAIGTWAIIVGVAVLLLWIPLRQRPGIGTVSNVILVGLTMDVVLGHVHAPQAMAARIACLVCGVFLNEPASAPLIAGAVLVVAGGVLLARERERPAHLNRLGLVLAFAGATLFAIRDNLVRHLAVGSTAVPPAVAAAAALLGGTVLIAVWARQGIGRRWIPFLPAGVFFGASYVCLFEAYYRGRVTVVAPLVAIESLVGVALSAVLLRDSELVGRRLVFAAALVVAGGALIGAFR